MVGNTGYRSVRRGGVGRNCSGRRNRCARNGLVNHRRRRPSVYIHFGAAKLDDMKLRGSYDPNRCTVNG